MGELNLDHQERMLRLTVPGEFKVVTVSTRKAADAYAEGAYAKGIEAWAFEYADLICCVPDSRTACSAAR